MSQRRTVIIVTASFHGEVVQTRFVDGGGVFQVGRSDLIDVPVPEGAPYLARVKRVGAEQAEVVDGQGATYTLAPDRDVVIHAGGVELRLSMAPRFMLRRTQPWSVRASVGWLAVVMLSTLITQQSELIYSHRCDLFAFTPQLAYSLGCVEPGAQGGVQADQMQEYLVRLLQQDTSGEDQGAISNKDPSTRPGTSKNPEHFVMPVGSEGPKTKADGAEEVSPEPVRTPPAKRKPRQPKQAEPVEQLALSKPDETPAPLPSDAVADPDDAIGALEVTDDDGEDEDDTPPPSEKERGFGLHDWYTERDQMREELEVKVMVEVAKRRLRIDPESADALQLMAYYQYLAEKLPDAMNTYDKFIELYPEDSAGYNNKALVYKRLKKYDIEEALYRKALSLQPMDVTALNNLAVNLAHQGRFDEALEVMRQLETLDPGEPYADLHRSKIYAEMGNREKALYYLDLSLQGMRKLDTLHHIEFRQDIRVDPSFAKLRKDPEFTQILMRYYGADTPVKAY